MEGQEDPKKGTEPHAYPKYQTTPAPLL